MTFLVCDPEVQVYRAKCNSCGEEFNPYPTASPKEGGPPPAYKPKDEHPRLRLVARVGPKTNQE